MDMEYVRTEVCNERHQRNRQTLEQLMELQKRTAEIEEQPRRRWEQVLGIIVNWATLALLGLLAVKIGL